MNVICPNCGISLRFSHIARHKNALDATIIQLFKARTSLHLENNTIYIYIYIYVFSQPKALGLERRHIFKHLRLMKQQFINTKTNRKTESVTIVRTQRFETCYESDRTFI